MANNLLGATATITLSHSVPKKLRDAVIAYVTRMLGGVTLIPGTGTYVRQDNGMVDTDDITVLTVHAPLLQGNTRDIIEAAVGLILEKSEEEAVLWSYNGSTYLETRDVPNE